MQKEKIFVQQVIQNRDIKTQPKILDGINY